MLGLKSYSVYLLALTLYGWHAVFLSLVFSNNEWGPKIRVPFLISYFRVLNVVCFLLGNCPSSEFRRRGITQKKAYDMSAIDYFVYRSFNIEKFNILVIECVPVIFYGTQSKQWVFSFAYRIK